ncbi:MAG TPA: hypothetical protein VGH83_11185 [Candidatus Acidoferrum sp.]|jgi:hypothetical protein
MGTSGPHIEQLKQNMKAAWMAGDFGQIARYSAAEAEILWSGYISSRV